MNFEIKQTMTKSIWQKYGPPALARGLWGKGSIPTRYKVLFAGQAVVFMLAMRVRALDVEKAQMIKKLQDEHGPKGEEGLESNGPDAKEEPVPVNR